MKKMKKLIAVFLSAIMCLSFCVPVFAEGNTDYTIVNPYESVDWSTYKTYLANLHTHTTASDGDVTLTDMVEAYYEKGYDILAITDHGVINKGWKEDRKTNGVFNKFRKVYPMSEEDYDRITQGTDRDGRGMIDIPDGIEINMAVVSKTHVNGYFTDYGQGEWGIENDYKTAVSMIEQRGGYSVLNHVGDWVNSNNYPERAHDPYYINYFADIFVNNKRSCLGMEIVNSTDNVTRYDRALWDELLQVVIPQGRNIWGFSDDDSEQLYEIGRSFELFPLKENTVKNVKNAMISGAFFSASRFYKTDLAHPFEGDGQVPLVKSITVNQDENTITVVPDKSRDCEKIEWIANGKVISNDYTIDLNDFENELGCYIRFQLKGKGGYMYSQPFELKYEGRVDKPIPASPVPNNIFGKMFEKIYHTRLWAVTSLILEKIEIKLGILPKDKVK